MHWKSWADISNVKGKGGLGFRDVQCFNNALLAKQVWRMLTNPNLLVSKVVKRRYFPKSSILDARVKNGALWIWQSLHSSIEMLKSGLRKQVGDGTTIAIWKDGWLKTSSGKISTPKPHNCPVDKVSDLIHDHKWNSGIINSLFSPEETKLITAIPLSLFGGKDRYTWCSSANGEYTTKTGYVKAKERMERNNKRLLLQESTSKNKQNSRI